MNHALKITTHLAAVLAGVALAAVVPKLIAKGSSGETTDANRASVESDAAKGSKRSGKHGQQDGDGESKPAAFLRAWRLLSQEPLAPEARMTAQGALLKEWAAVDLDGAIQAYMGEAWDSRYPGTVAFISEPLRNALFNAFSERPMESWKALKRDKMTMQLLGSTWNLAMRYKDPGMMIAMIGEMPANLQADAVENLVVHEKHDALLDQLAKAATPEQAERWMMAAYIRAPKGGDPAALSAKWIEQAAGGERIHGMAAWASTLRRAELAAFATEWDKVPEADRGQAARLLLAPLNKDSPALLFAIDRAIEAGEWQALSQGVAEKLNEWKGMDRDGLAEWAMDLPAKPELIAIYQQAISKKLLDDPVAGRAWLEQLPEGDWHRECGFVELASRALRDHKDEAAAQRAIDAITDPEARHAAEKARYDWSLVTGQRELRRN